MEQNDRQDSIGPDPVESRKTLEFHGVRASEGGGGTEWTSFNPQTAWLFREAPAFPGRSRFA